MTPSTTPALLRAVAAATTVAALASVVGATVGVVAYVEARRARAHVCAPHADPPRAQAPREIELSRAFVREQLGDLDALTRAARILPELEDGKVIGFRIFGFRPRSVFAEIGLKNGDVVRSVNGLALTTPDSALAAYDKLQTADALAVEVTRRGVPLVIHYTIVD